MNRGDRALSCLGVAALPAVCHVGLQQQSEEIVACGLAGPQGVLSFRDDALEDALDLGSNLSHPSVGFCRPEPGHKSNASAHKLKFAPPWMMYVQKESNHRQSTETRR